MLMLPFTFRMIKHDHSPFVIAYYALCVSEQFRVLLDFIFRNYKGNYVNTTAMNHNN